MAVWQQGKRNPACCSRTLPPSPGQLLAIPLALLPLLVLLLLFVALPGARAFTFPFTCNVSTTIAPDAPGSVNDTSAPLCPSCCKQPLNLTFVGTPTARYKNVATADRCITLCSTNSYYAVTQDQVCECYDECDEAEQITVDPTLVQPMLALGNITACLTPCFPPTSDEPWCGCPLHSTCLPGPLQSGKYRCCCDPLYSNPTSLPDNTSACMGFELGSNLFGVQNLALVNEAP